MMIFLVGPRGSGKSTVARVLAARLGWSWVDADVALEKKFGQPIRDIIAEEGWDGFRARESVVLAELCQLQQHVVATGGGVVLSEANRNLLQRTGQVIWLTAPPEVLWNRTQNDPSTEERRPALLSRTGLEEMQAIVQQREPLYRSCAQTIIETTDRSPEALADEIVGWLTDVLHSSR